MTIPYTDILIASCASSAGCVLLHADRHFDLVAGRLNLKNESFVKTVRKITTE